MHASRGGFRVDLPKHKRNAAIVQAKREGLSTAEVARLFSVSTGRVLQICAQAARAERFAREHTESGGRARVRTLGRVAETAEDARRCGDDVEQGAVLGVSPHYVR